MVVGYGSLPPVNDAPPRARRDSKGWPSPSPAQQGKLTFSGWLLVTDPTPAQPGQEANSDGHGTNSKSVNAGRFLTTCLTGSFNSRIPLMGSEVGDVTDLSCAGDRRCQNQVVKHIAYLCSRIVRSFRRRGRRRGLIVLDVRRAINQQSGRFFAKTCRRNKANR